MVHGYVPCTERQFRRTNRAGNCVANIVSGVVAYGIGHIHADDITTWQALFIILGAVTCVIAIGLGFLLPDSPAKAIFLNKRERAIILQRTLKNKTGVLDTGKFKWDQAFQAIKDPQTWFIVIYNFTTCLWNGGITSVSRVPIYCEIATLTDRPPSSAPSSSVASDSRHSSKPIHKPRHRSH